MPRVSPLYHQHRQVNGNHRNWRDRRQSTQNQLNEHVARLARQPGLHSGNVHRRNMTQAMLQLLAILSAAHMSSARSTTPPDATNADATNADARETERAAAFPTNQYPVYSGRNLSGFTPYSRPLYPSTTEQDRTNTLSGSRQKRGLSSSDNIPYAIMDIIAAERFDYRLRDELDRIFMSAPATPEVKYAQSRYKNLYTLLKCVQQMHCHIIEKGYRYNERQILNALLDIANNLDLPREKATVDKFKEGFTLTDAINSTAGISNSSMADSARQKDFCEKLLIFSSFEEERIIVGKQTRRIKTLLEEHHLVTQKHEPLSVVNNLVKFLSEGDYPELQRAVVQALTKPLQQLNSGLEKDTNSSDERPMAMISTYLTQTIFDMSLEEWCAKQLQMMKSYPSLSFNNGYLQSTLYNVLSRPSRKGVLSLQARTFYQDEVLNKRLPTLTLKLNGTECEALQTMNISEPRWGFVHAGAMLLSNSGAELSVLTLAKIEEIGMTLYASLSQGAVPVEYLVYFRLPALLCYVKDIYVSDLLMLNEQDIEQVYRRYFNYINSWEKKNNPLARLADLYSSWKNRTELAKEYLINYGVSEEWESTYLNSHHETIFETKNWTGADCRNGNVVKEVRCDLGDGLVSLPNIDTVFEKQNRQLADTAYEVDKLLLPAALESLSEQEQQFIEQAQVDRVRVEFINWVAFSIVTRGEKSKPEKLIYQIPEHIDLLQCTSNGVERIYALDTAPKTGKYPFARVDRNRETLLRLLGNNTILSHDPRYTLKVTSELTLKKAEEKPNKLVENLAEYHRKNLMIRLEHKGYDKTTQEKIEDFLLGFIPFYTCITESINGNISEAIPACVMDVIGLIPFVGQAVYAGSRFGSVLTRSTLMALRYGAKQTTIKAMMRQTGKNMLTHFPSIANKISPQVIKKLGIGFVDGLDPGFELLAAGGVKGIRALKDVLSKMPDKSPALQGLQDALQNSISLKQQNKKPVKGRGRPYPNVFDGNPSSSGLNALTLSDIKRFEEANSVKLMKYNMGDTSYIQYYLKSLNNDKASEDLVISAHGGFTTADTKAPVVVLPSDITIKMLSPHGTALNNPKLDNLINAGKDLKAYITITNDEVISVDFLPQIGNPKWLYSENYDPYAIQNVLGREDGLQNYRHIRYERESDMYIAQVLIKNYELAKKQEATLTDIITVSSEISTLKDASLEKASVQKILDLDRAGRLLNAKGERYKTISFCHCRCSFDQPNESISLYFMVPAQLEKIAKKTAPKSATTSEVTMTLLYRKDVSSPFEIKNYKIGRFAFILLKRSIMNTTSPSSQGKK